MPYRRLPNTDAARSRALNKAIEMSKKLDYKMLAFQQTTLRKILAFLPKFEQARMMQKEAKSRQTSNSRKYVEAFKKAKIYISHFLQVLNLAIVRGEIKPSARKYYGLDEKSSRLPDLTTEKDVVEWGAKVIKGEKDRVMKTGNPILSPKIAIVTIYYDDFLEKMNFQKTLQSISVRANEKISMMRPECDALVTNLWNEIEEYYSQETIERKRQQAGYYGVTYAYRPYEKKEANSRLMA